MAGENLGASSTDIIELTFGFKHKPHANLRTLNNSAFLIFSSAFINSFMLNTMKSLDVAIEVCPLK